MTGKIPYANDTNYSDIVYLAMYLSAGLGC